MMQISVHCVNIRNYVKEKVQIPTCGSNKKREGRKGGLL